jgi:hypothetical protein
LEPVGEALTFSFEVRETKLLDVKIVLFIAALSERRERESFECFKRDQ